MKRLDIDTWVDIFMKIKDIKNEESYVGVFDWIEVVWLDSSNKWCLCYGKEILEDGFKTEEEARERLEYLEDIL
ncbi:hypothetical protein ACFWDG_12235 [Peribacillus sp. NPDC060186]